MRTQQRYNHCGNGQSNIDASILAKAAHQLASEVQQQCKHLSDHVQLEVAQVKIDHRSSFDNLTSRVENTIEDMGTKTEVMYSECDAPVQTLKVNIDKTQSYVNQWELITKEHNTQYTTGCYAAAGAEIVNASRIPPRQIGGSRLRGWEGHSKEFGW